MSVGAAVEAAAESPSTTAEVIRHSGSIGLGEDGTLLEIAPAGEGRFSWSLSWKSRSVTLTKDDYLKGESWFAFIESPSRVWFFDGIEELLLVERADDGFSQRYAFYQGDAYPLFDVCPAPVLEALPKKVSRPLME